MHFYTLTSFDYDSHSTIFVGSQTKLTNDELNQKFKNAMVLAVECGRRKRIENRPMYFENVFSILRENPEFLERQDLQVIKPEMDASVFGYANTKPDESYSSFYDKVPGSVTQALIETLNNCGYSIPCEKTEKRHQEFLESFSNESEDDAEEYD